MRAWRPAVEFSRVVDRLCLDGRDRLIAVTQLSDLPAPEQSFGSTQELAAM